VLVALLAIASAACGGDATQGLPGADEPPSTGTSAPASTVDDGDDGPPVPVLPVTVESADGRAVTVTDVSRIVPLQGNISEIVFDLGLGASVVARDVSTTFEEARDLPLVTRAHDVSAESVLSLHPTVVLIDSDTGPQEAIDHIRNVGVPVVEIERPTGIDDIAPRIEAIAGALGVPEAGQALAARTADDLEAAMAAVDDADAPTVAFLYFRGNAGVYLIGGPGSGADSMIAAAGGVDAGTRLGLDEPFTPITSEAMAGAAPDVILMTTTGLDSVGGVDGLVEVPGIAQTPAGQNRRVATLEDGLLFNFGTRTPQAIEVLADQLAAAAPS
jgi:iron complex transport system substrate-binding protein